MRVLILLPAYNSADTIDESIRSVLRQTHKNWILVLVDDGSTDDTFEIARSWAEQHPNIELLQTDRNRGTYAAYNLALQKHMHTDWQYFTLQGADDVSHEDRLVEMISTASSQPVAHFVCCRYKRIEPKTNEVVSVRAGEGVALVSRACFETLGFFRTTRFGGDTEYMLRVRRWLELGGRPAGIYKTRKLLYTAYQTGSNLTARYPHGSVERQQFMADVAKDHGEAKSVSDLYVAYHTHNSGLYK